MNIFKNFFGNTSEKKEEVEIIDNDELKKVIEDVFSQVDNICFIKSKHWIESNVCRGDKESFEIFKEQINDKGLDLEFGAGEYTIIKNIKNSRGSVSSILCRFKFEEIKKED